MAQIPNNDLINKCERYAPTPPIELFMFLFVKISEIFFPETILSSAFHTYAYEKKAINK